MNEYVKNNSWFIRWCILIDVPDLFTKFQFTPLQPTTAKGRGGAYFIWFSIFTDLYRPPTACHSLGEGDGGFIIIQKLCEIKILKKL